MALTAKQEHFAQLVAAGATLSDAYRQSYDISPDSTKKTIWEQSSLLASNPMVAARIQELKAAAQAAAIAEIAWDKAQLIRQADRHRELALSGGWRGVGSANGALELIGRVTGLLNDKQPGTLPVQITRVVVVLSDGRQQPGPELPEGRIVPAVGDEKLRMAAALDDTLPSPDEDVTS